MCGWCCCCCLIFDVAAEIKSANANEKAEWEKAKAEDKSVVGDRLCRLVFALTIVNTTPTAPPANNSLCDNDKDDKDVWLMMMWMRLCCDQGGVDCTASLSNVDCRWKYLYQSHTAPRWCCSGSCYERAWALLDNSLRLVVVIVNSSHITISSYHTSDTHHQKDTTIDSTRLTHTHTNPLPAYALLYPTHVNIL